MESVKIENVDAVRIVSLNRPEKRNAINPHTSKLLYSAFKEFDQDETSRVAILTGVGDHFCAGFDLNCLADPAARLPDSEEDRSPLGPARLILSKPVIAAIEGYAVAGGLELAIWCDLRVVSEQAKLGVFCRRVGVPLVDLGTYRLPRLIGHSRAMDMILTGREISGSEAFEIGLANRLVPPGDSLQVALEIALALSRFPQQCMRGDRLSTIKSWELDYRGAIAFELAVGKEALRTGEQFEAAEKLLKTIAAEQPEEPN